MLKNFYNKIIEKASKKSAEYFLALISFAESSFFPIPPDILLIPMVLARSKKWFRIALISTIFSVLGGLLGYVIGIFLWELLGEPIINFYKLHQEFIIFKNNYAEKGAFIVFMAGISPIPYKLITIASGGLNLNIFIFILSSFLSRGLRFFILALLIRIFGETAKKFIEKNIILSSSILGIFLLILLIIVIYL